MVKSVYLEDKDRVKKISELASKEPYDIWVSGSTTILNAKSILGLFALIGQKVNIVAEDNVDPYRFMHTVNKMMA